MPGKEDSDEITSKAPLPPRAGSSSRAVPPSDGSTVQKPSHGTKHTPPRNDAKPDNVPLEQDNPRENDSTSLNTAEEDGDRAPVQLADTARTFSKNRQQVRLRDGSWVFPGAVAVTPSASEEIQEEHLEDPQGEDGASPTSTDRRDSTRSDATVTRSRRRERGAAMGMTVAEEVDDVDIEDEVQARVRQHTEGITQQVHQRLQDAVVTADVVTSSDKSSSERVCSTRLILVAALTTLILAAAAVGMGVAVSGGGSSDPVLETASPTLSPTASPTVDLGMQRLQRLREPLLEVSDASLLDDETSAQYAALEWLAYNDTADLFADDGSPLNSVKQRYIIALFYFAMGGTEWTNQFFFLSDDKECRWAADAMGVRCHLGTDTVKDLLFASNNLRGQIPSELLHLTRLQSIDFGVNQVTGSIPSELGQLPFLESLFLADNFLTGVIPDSILSHSKLEQLNLYRNSGLGGSLLSLNARRLRTLAVSRCSLTGSLPDSIGDLNALRTVKLHYNALAGNIPPSLFQLPNLRSLDLRDNLFSGMLPPINGSDSLREFIIDDNYLEGPIPASLGLLPNLQILSLANNEFTGTIPPFSGNNAALEQFWLGGNLNITGGIESFLESILGTNLTVLSASANDLGGTLPTLLGNFTSLEELWLRGNGIEGQLPSELGKLTALTTLDLQTNQLMGSIPTELGLMENIVALGLGQNQLDGTVPSELGLLTQMLFLEVGSNDLIGTLCTQFGNLASLETLGLAANDISGTVPTGWQSMTSLETLYLHFTDITGDLTPIFCSGNHSIVNFKSDCQGPQPETICPCCSECCNDANRTCAEQV